MFKTAYEIASKFTQPLILSYRFYDKSVATGLGTFIILNNDGWIITAAHNLAVSSLYVQHQKEIQEYNSKVEAINQLHQNQKKREFKNLKPNPKWITDFVIWLGNDGVKVVESHVYTDHDIAFLRVDKTVFSTFHDYPKIKNPNNIKIGASLCKLGFPFHAITATFEEQNKQFRFPPELFPIPRFPIEGIYTRNIVEGKSQDGTMDVMFIETSSPGLRGQSGGPVVDLDGNIYAVQSKNVTMPLGFTGFVETNGKRVEENQFINVGIGVHTNTIIALLNKHGIKFDIAE